MRVILDQLLCRWRWATVRADGAVVQYSEGRSKEPNDARIIIQALLAADDGTDIILETEAILILVIETVRRNPTNHGEEELAQLIDELGERLLLNARFRAAVNMELDSLRPG